MASAKCPARTRRETAFPPCRGRVDPSQTAQGSGHAKNFMTYNGGENGGPPGPTGGERCARIRDGFVPSSTRRSTVRASLIVAALLLTSLVCPPDTCGQISGTDSAALASGTLNLVLANKNGFVIAADSRMTWTTPVECRKGARKRRHCDNSQKLFRTGQRSAMVVAGFAVGRGRTPTPLDLVVASVLRKEFGPCGHKILQQSLSDRAMTVVCASDESLPAWARTDLEPALTGVASILDSGDPQPPVFEATFAGIDKKGRVLMQQQVFHGSWARLDANTLIPKYQKSRRVIPAEHFAHPTVGITGVADQILEGQYSSSDPVLTTYYGKLHAGQVALDSMGIADLTELARVILRETKKFTNLVGGPDQIGVFPVKGKPQWIMPQTLPSARSLPPRFFLNRCLAYTKGKRVASEACASGTFSEDFSRPLDEVITQFFLGCRFNGVSVALDNNYFVRSQFDGVTFKYTGNKPPFARENTYGNCTVELPEGVPVPSGSDVFDHCKKVRTKSVALDEDTVGKPVSYQKVDGRLVLPTPH